MRGWKRASAAAALAAAAVLSTAIYLNFHCFYSSKKAGLSPERKISLLGRANGLWPVLDQTLAEEGKIRLDQALDALPDVASARISLESASVLLRRALRLNPASAAHHLVYARTLRYLGYVSESEVPESLPELWKAARLAGRKSPLDFDLSRELLENWAALDEEQKEWTLELVGQVLGREDTGQFQTILQVWDLTVGDSALFEVTLPDSSKLLRAYAAFLGEKSRSLETRQRLLARAETIDYNRAVRELDGGNPGGCLNLLDGIRYYGALKDGADIGPLVIKHDLLRKEALLSRAKAQILKARRLEEAEAALRAYLALEEDYGKRLALETFLKEMNILGEETFLRPTFEDLRRLAFEMFLMFRLNKYNNITALGSVIQGGVFVVKNAEKPYLSEIYTLIADAYDKLNFIYEPESLYLKALELQPRNWKTLFKLRRYYERLNEKDKVAEIDGALADVLTPAALAPADGLIFKGDSRRFDLVLESGPAGLTLNFEEFEEEFAPLIAVFFRGRVIWENFLDGSELVLGIEAREGPNRLEIAVINRPVRLLGLRIFY